MGAPGIRTVEHILATETMRLTLGYTFTDRFSLTQQQLSSMSQSGAIDSQFLDGSKTADRLILILR
ncbi:hypothetical protein HC766_09340 [Candidatus Gracilibacteria bacterium]|nr:hypothetical protein [Candidatus Gracilibacteria bacterium]